MSAEKKSPASTSTVEAPPHPYEPVKRKIVDFVADCAKHIWNKDLSASILALVSKVERPRDVTNGDLCLPTFSMLASLKPAVNNPAAISSALAPVLAEKLSQLPEVDKVVAAGPYLNFFLSSSYLGQVVTAINEKGFLNKLSSDNKDKVMIEYSQPNTHKAFHVGHMRNAALGDFLVRVYEHCGYPVVPANYFGDEGAHVAKCIWYLRRFFFSEGKTLKDLAPPLGETLGKFYQDAVTLLDLSCLTKYPFPGVYAAEVVSIQPHPSPKAPKNWHVVQVKMGEGPEHLHTVVCGGWGYKEGDKVAYVPVGAKFNKKVVAPVDKDGVLSHGIMLARKELDLPTEEEEKKKAEEAKKKADEAAADGQDAGGKKQPEKAQGKQKDNKPAAKPNESEKPQQGKDGKKDKGQDKQEQKEKGKDKQEQNKDATKEKEQGKGAANKDAAAKKDDKERQNPLNQIFVLPKEAPAGVNLCEFGRVDASKIEPPHWVLPAERKLEDEMEQRETEVRAVLLALEHKDAQTTQLWQETKDMCIKEFKEIYAWLGVRFDHDFYESEMTEEAKKIVNDFLEKGALVRDAGAVGADLKKFGLGFLVLLKSDGSTLYATKDLALARRKFEQFKVDKSVYVVDAAQTMHFQQVFKTLDVFGYEQAKKCFHLPYGMVVLPEGRMSSRKGTIVYFNTLKNNLYKRIYNDYLAQYEGTWDKSEIEAAVQAISVGAIKYGMLNTDSAKDIVFNMESWTSLKGNTGVYLMYAFTRMNKILRDVSPKAGAKLDFSCLDHPVERRMLSSLNEFWSVVCAAAGEYNSSPLCNYLFDLCKDASSWYELDDRSVKNCPDPHVQFTRLAFLKAISQTVRVGLQILGIKVLDRM